jgi:hypothetical protein
MRTATSVIASSASGVQVTTTVSHKCDTCRSLLTGGHLDELPKHFGFDVQTILVPIMGKTIDVDECSHHRD